MKTKTINQLKVGDVIFNNESMGIVVSRGETILRDHQYVVIKWFWRGEAGTGEVMNESRKYYEHLSKHKKYAVVFKLGCSG